MPIHLSPLNACKCSFFQLPFVRRCLIGCLHSLQMCHFFHFFLFYCFFAHIFHVASIRTLKQFSFFTLYFPLALVQLIFHHINIYLSETTSFYLFFNLFFFMYFVVSYFPFLSSFCIVIFLHSSPKHLAPFSFSFLPFQLSIFPPLAARSRCVLSWLPSHRLFKEKKNVCVWYSSSRARGSRQHTCILCVSIKFVFVSTKRTFSPYFRWWHFFSFTSLLPVLVRKQHIQNIVWAE